MSHKTGRKRGAWFALSMLGCCKGTRREEMSEKKDTKSCMESASNAACSCVGGSGGSTLSSYAYMPSAEYRERYQVELSQLLCHPRKDIYPDPSSLVYHYLAYPRGPRPSEQSSIITACEKQLREMEKAAVNENPVNRSEIIDEVTPSEFPMSDKEERDQMANRINNNEMFLRLHERMENRSVDSVRSKVLEEHAGWQMNATKAEKLLEDEDVVLPEVLLQNDDDNEGYEEWKQSHHVVLQHLAGKHKK